MPKESWSQEQARRKREARAQLKLACEVLARLGVTAVVARYDGAGDEGWVEQVAYEPEPPAGIPEGLS